MYWALCSAAPGWGHHASVRSASTCRTCPSRCHRQPLDLRGLAAGCAHESDRPRSSDLGVVAGWVVHIAEWLPPAVSGLHRHACQAAHSGMIAVKWVKDAARGRPCAETAAPGCVQPATAPWAARTACYPGQARKCRRPAAPYPPGGSAGRGLVHTRLTGSLAPGTRPSADLAGRMSTPAQAGSGKLSRDTITGHAHLSAREDEGDWGGGDRQTGSGAGAGRPG